VAEEAFRLVAEGRGHGKIGGSVALDGPLPSPGAGPLTKELDNPCLVGIGQVHQVSGVQTRELEVIIGVGLPEPFKLPPEKYERWKTMKLNFDPRDMLGL